MATTQAVSLLNLYAKGKRSIWRNFRSRVFTDVFNFMITNCLLPSIFRSAVEEVYAKSLLKLAKSATPVTQLG